MTREAIMSGLRDVPGLVVLHDSSVAIRGIEFWGSSWNNCMPGDGLGRNGGEEG